MSLEITQRPERGTGARSTNDQRIPLVERHFSPAAPRDDMHDGAAARSPSAPSIDRSSITYSTVYEPTPTNRNRREYTRNSHRCEQRRHQVPFAQDLVAPTRIAYTQGERPS